MHLLLETRRPLSRHAHCDLSVVTLWCQSTSLRKSSWLLFKDLGAVRVGQNRRRAFHLEEVLTQNSVLHLRDILSLPLSSNRAAYYRRAAFQCVLTLPCKGGPRSDPPALSRCAPPVPLPAVPGGGAAPERLRAAPSAGGAAELQAEGAALVPGPAPVGWAELSHLGAFCFQLASSFSSLLLAIEQYC